MEFDLYPSVDVTTFSLRLGGSYLSKDKLNNRFRRTLSHYDHMLKIAYEDNGQIKPLTARERRKLRHYEQLSQQACDFFHDTYNKIGPFKFAFYGDDEDPLEKPIRTIKLSEINTSYVIQSGILTAITR